MILQSAASVTKICGLVAQTWIKNLNHGQPTFVAIATTIRMHDLWHF